MCYGIRSGEMTFLRSLKGARHWIIYDKRDKKKTKCGGIVQKKKS